MLIVHDVGWRLLMHVLITMNWLHLPHIEHLDLEPLHQKEMIVASLTCP